MDSYLSWWQDAGVTDAVGDVAFDWLMTPSTVAYVPKSAVSDNAANDAHPSRSTAKAGKAPAPIPDDLDAFDRWWLEEPTVPGGDWAGPRIAATGPVNAPLMLLADVPDNDDIRAGRLFVGQAGDLLTAMLAAIGLNRDHVRIATLAATRPAGGRIDPALNTSLAAVAIAHIRLARPQHLLLLGGQTSLILTGTQVASSPTQYKINHSGATLAPYAIHHPRLLLERPSLKRHAWSVLKMLRESR